MDTENISDDIVALIPSMRIYAKFLCKYHIQSDDLVQDALERALRNRDTFQQGSNLKAWLFSILRNRWTDEFRRQKFVVEDVDGLHAKRLVAPAEQHWRLQYADLISAIDAMPPGPREALFLVIGYGLSHEEAAAVLGCPLGTVKSWIRRARSQLSSIIDIDT